MNVKLILSKVQSSDLFKEWFAKNDSAVLSHIFFTEKDENTTFYDVGYYIKDKDVVASFELNGEAVEAKGESEVFKHPDHKVPELNIENVKVESDAALKTAKELQEKEYKNAIPFKRIIILQNIEDKDVWNITYVTQSFKTLNIKINAETGEVADHKLLDLIQKTV